MSPGIERRCRSIRTRLSELADPQALREAVARSGVAYERHLSELAGSADARRARDSWYAALQTATRSSGRAQESSLSRLDALQTDNKALLLRQLADSRHVQQAHAPASSAARSELSPSAMSNPELLANEIRALESGLARIELNQLLSLNEQSGIRQPLRVELPILVDDEYRDLLLELDVEDTTDGAAPSSTKVARVRLDLPVLGVFGAELRLREDAFWVSIWAQQAATRELLTERAAGLRERLQASGLPTPQVAVLEQLPDSELDGDEIAKRLPRGMLAVNV